MRVLRFAPTHFLCGMRHASRFRPHESGHQFRAGVPILIWRGPKYEVPFWNYQGQSAVRLPQKSQKPQVVANENLSPLMLTVNSNSLTFPSWLGLGTGLRIGREAGNRIGKGPVGLFWIMDSWPISGQSMSVFEGATDEYDRAADQRDSKKSQSHAA